MSRRGAAPRAGSDRGRVGERLQASLAGLLELELLRDTQRGAVAGALGRAAPQVSASGAPSAGPGGPAPHAAGCKVWGGGLTPLGVAQPPSSCPWGAGSAPIAGGCVRGEGSRSSLHFGGGAASPAPGAAGTPLLLARGAGAGAARLGWLRREQFTCC